MSKKDGADFRPSMQLRRLSSFLSGKSHDDEQQKQAPSSPQANGSPAQSHPPVAGKRLSGLTAKMRSYSGNGKDRVPKPASPEQPPVPRVPSAYSSETVGSSSRSRSMQPLASTSLAQDRTPSPPRRLSSKATRRRSEVLHNLLPSNSKRQSQEAERRRVNSIPAADTLGRSSSVLERNVSSDAQGRPSRDTQVPQYPRRPTRGPSASATRRWSRNLLPSPLSPDTSGSRIGSEDKSSGTFNLRSFYNVRPDGTRVSMDVQPASESVASAQQSVASRESPETEFHSPAVTPSMQSPQALPESPMLGAKSRPSRVPAHSIPVSAFRKAAGRSRNDLDSPMLGSDADTPAGSSVAGRSSPISAFGLQHGSSMSNGLLASPIDGARSPAQELAELEASLPRSRALMLLQRSQTPDASLKEALAHESQIAQRPVSPPGRDSYFGIIDSFATAAQESPEVLSIAETEKDGRGDINGEKSASELTSPDGFSTESFLSRDVTASVGSADKLGEAQGADAPTQDGVDPSEKTGLETPEINEAGIGLSSFAGQRRASMASLSAKERHDEVKAFHEEHAEALSKALSDGTTEDRLVARIAWPAPPCVSEEYHGRLPAIHQHSLYMQHCRAAESALAEYMRLMAGVVPPDVMVQPKNLFANPNSNSRRGSHAEVKRSQTIHTRSNSHGVPWSSPSGLNGSGHAGRRRSFGATREPGAAGSGLAGEPVPPLPIAPIPPLLTFVTGNGNKLKEVKAALMPEGDPIKLLLTNTELDLPEVQGTTQEVAHAKCKAAAQKIKGPCLTEDTALVFSAFGDLPGPYIKSFASTLGNADLARLLHGFSSNHSATAICTFGLVMGAQSEPILFEGRVEGTIVAPRGSGTFGWDNIFQPKGGNKTFGEMTAEEKANVSHRGRALMKLRAHLKQHPVRIEPSTPISKGPIAKFGQVRDSESSTSSLQARSSDAQLRRTSHQSSSSLADFGASPHSNKSTTPKQNVLRHRRSFGAAIVDKTRSSLRRRSRQNSSGVLVDRKADADGADGSTTADSGSLQLSPTATRSSDTDSFSIVRKPRSRVATVG